MSEEKYNAEEWWAGLSAAERCFFREVIGLAEGLAEDEVIRLTFNGRSFSPVLVSEDQRGVPFERLGNLSGGAMSEPDDWWGELNGPERGFVQALARIILGLQKHPEECLEIKNTGEGFRVTHLLVLKAPTGGRAELN
jgi:hypothetical protein